MHTMILRTIGTRLRFKLDRFAHISQKYSKILHCNCGNKHMANGSHQSTNNWLYSHNKTKLSKTNACVVGYTVHGNIVLCYITSWWWLMWTNYPPFVRIPPLVLAQSKDYFIASDNIKFLDSYTQISNAKSSLFCCILIDDVKISVRYNYVRMSAMASQITSLTIVYSGVYSGADQRKHQGSVSLAFVWGIHRWPLMTSP